MPTNGFVGVDLFSRNRSDQVVTGATDSVWVREGVQKSLLNKPLVLFRLVQPTHYPPPIQVVAAAAIVLGRGDKFAARLPLRCAAF